MERISQNSTTDIHKFSNRTLRLSKQPARPVATIPFQVEPGLSVVDEQALVNNIVFENVRFPTAPNNTELQAEGTSSRPQHAYYPELDQFQLVQAGLDYARKKKPSGREKKGPKLPNQIRHDENAAIAVGTWKKRSKKQTEKAKPKTQ